MRRAIVVAHHDPDGVVDPHVERALAAYRPHADRLVLVSTSVRALPGRLGTVVDDFIPRANVGYDFGSWAAGLAALSPAGGFSAPGLDEVVCVNDSVWGPLVEPGRLFTDARVAGADLWGMVLSLQPPRGGGRAPRPHLQSWFFAARRPLLDAEAWRGFWEGVGPLPTKHDVVSRLELGLSESVAAAGFRIAALWDAREEPGASWRDLVPHLSPLHPRRAWRLLRKSRRGHVNPAELLPVRLLAAGVPYVKVSVPRVNHYGLDTSVVLDALSRAGARGGYDPDLVTAHLARIGRLGDDRRGHRAGAEAADWKASGGVR